MKPFLLHHSLAVAAHCVWEAQHPRPYGCMCRFYLAEANCPNAPPMSPAHNILTPDNFYRSQERLPKLKDKREAA
jgi:hypothetical protein